MLKLIGWLIKTTIFAALVLVLGNLIHWQGRTISDQVKAQLAHVEKQTRAVKAIAADYVAEEAPRKIAAATGQHVTPQSAPALGRPARPGREEQIDPSEKLKLRALIRDLSHDRVRQVSGN